MKKFLLILVVAAGAFLAYKFLFKKEEPKKEKPKPLAVSAHSEGFNQAVNNMLDDYYQMTDGFVNWDAEKVNKSSAGLQVKLDSLKVDELKKDSTIYQTALFSWENAKSALQTINATADWNGRRRALQDLSDNLRTLLLTIKYDGATVYWQECPMAFGDGIAGNWLSAGEEVVNPYLGNKDPNHGSSMLHCGETKMKIDFTVPDTSNAY